MAFSASGTDTYINNIPRTIPTKLYVPIAQNRKSYSRRSYATVSEPISPERRGSELRSSIHENIRSRSHEFRRATEKGAAFFLPLAFVRRVRNGFPFGRVLTALDFEARHLIRTQSDADNKLNRRKRRHAVVLILMNGHTRSRDREPLYRMTI